LDIAKAPLDIAKAPLDIAKAPLDIAKAPLDIAKAPLDIAKAPLGKLIHKLPDELISMIMSYTYNIQNKELRQDINNYPISFYAINKIYLEIYADHSSDPIKESQEWLSNYLYGFCNNDVALMYGYADDFYKIFFQHPLLNTKSQVEKYIATLEQKDLNTQNRVFWGLMSPKQRHQFILRYT
jgi:hypothetical protein